MKTGAYWFKFLTDKEQEEFKENLTAKDFEIDMTLNFESFEEFISGAFLWKKTNQGDKYWKQISQRKTD